MTVTPDPGDVVIMQRLVEEARREFPHWTFTRTAEGWSAGRGKAEHTAGSLAELRALLRTTGPGWRVWRSDHGHWWGTREEPFTEAADASGAWRTVDADRELDLYRRIAEQESIADLAAS